MIQKPLALQMYSLNALWAENPLKAMTWARDCGYTGIEFYGNLYSADLCRALLRETGLVCAGWHTGIEQLEGDEFEKTLRMNIEVGNKYLVVPWFDGKTVDGWKAFCDRLNAIAQRLAKYGMKTGFHNHALDFTPVEGVMPWQILIDNTAPEVVLQMDTGNCMAGNGDPLEWVRKAAGRCQSIHCKPYSKKDGYECMAGKDDVQWKEILDFCSEKGATEWVIVEYESKNNPEQGVADISKFLSAL